MKMIGTSCHPVAISLVATAVVTSFALAENSQGDRAAKGSENEFKFEVLSKNPHHLAGQRGV
jgi:hypothetical protein